MNSNDNNNSSKIIIKAVCKQDIRKLYLLMPPKFNWFKKSIVSAFGLEDKNIKMTYVDEEGDNVTLANLNDLNIALESLPEGKGLKVIVKVLKAKVENKEEEEKESKINEGDNKESKIVPVKKLQKPLIKLEKFQPEQEAPESSSVKPEEKVAPLMKLQKPKPQPKAKENKPKEGKEETAPLLKLQKPKPQPKETKAKENKEDVVPLMKLQKPKPQPKAKENKEDVVPLMKLQKPKPQPKAKENKPKEGKEETVPLLKLQKPKPQPKETKAKEGEVVPLLKLRKIVSPQQQESSDVPVSSETSTSPTQETKIPIVYDNSSPVDQPQTPQPEEFLYKSSLNDVVVMGFPDTTYLRSLLVSNKGNVEATITQLLN